MNEPLLQTNVEGFALKRGKVRDVYEIDEDTLAIITTDRISAFDYVLPNGIPEKGKLLTQISLFWMDFLGYDNHLISDDLEDLPKQFRDQHKVLEDRTMLVRKCKVVPFECIARGFLTGSGWAEYQQSGMVAGIELPPGLQQNCQFPRPMFTPSTKEETGHDINITFREMTERTNPSLAQEMQQYTLDAFADALDYAWHRGIIIADTKFEWGESKVDSHKELLLIDEVLTPDSSRFWPVSEYKLGESIPSFDKQFVRDWLLQSSWDRKSPPPALPKEVVSKTRDKYFEAYYRLTGKAFV